MKKILLSLSILAFVGVVVVGATGAWFTNTETSTGNTFTAGIIDLKVGNESYITDSEGNLVLSTTGTSWGPSDLLGKYFFNFTDLKPGDVGEDTISLNVQNNPAWACLDLTVTETPENNPQTEPEALVDFTVGDNQGELQNELNFVFWKDDGDNVLEKDEEDSVFWKNSIQGISDSPTLALADSLGGVLENGSPLNPGETYYIGKAWCQGDLALIPVDQDFQGNIGTNGPLDRGTGIACNGASIGNASQTDGVVADVTFSVEQSRHNEKFLCNPPQEGTLTLIKEVYGGILAAGDFELFIDDGTTSFSDGDVVTLPAGVHNVTEGNYSDYDQKYGVDCPNGQVTVPANGNATCTVINTSTKGTITITKNVVGGLYENNPDFFNLAVGGEPVLSGVPEAFPAGVNYPVTEDIVSGYTASYSGDCDNNGNTITVTAGGSASCTITNTYTTEGTLKVTKIVSGGPAVNEDDFNLYVTSVSSAIVTPVDNGMNVIFQAGDYVVSEGDYSNYTTVIGGDCDASGNVTVPANGAASCTITNTWKTGTLTVNKDVVNDNGGNETISSFNLFIDGVAKTFGTTYTVEAGNYVVSETGVSGYDGSYSGDCDQNGNVTVPADGNAVCTIINDDIKPNITLIKNVDNTTGGSLGPQDFVMKINGITVPSGNSKSVNSNFANVITEIAVPGYTSTGITGDLECPAALGGTATLDEGQAITCTITNTYTGGPS